MLLATLQLLGTVVWFIVVAVVFSHNVTWGLILLAATFGPLLVGLVIGKIAGSPDSGASERGGSRSDGGLRHGT